MIQNILKLREGSSVSKKDWQAAKSNYEQLYAQADDLTKEQMDALMQTSQNYSGANPRNNRSVREYQTQMYNNAAAIMNGTYSGSYAPTMSTPNGFNGYSHQENINDANYATNYYLNLNKDNNTASSSTTVNPNGQYVYNWRDGLGWGLNDETLSQKITRLCKSLAGNLQSALDARTGGKNVKGTNGKLDNFSQYIGILQQAANKANSDPNAALQDILTIAPQLGMTEEDWDGYFGNTLPGQDVRSQAIKNWTDQGYELVNDGSNYGDDLNNLITSNGYHVIKKGNRTYLVDENYNDFIRNNASTVFNTDWRNGKEGTGYALNNEGEFISGDLNEIYANQDNPFSAQLRQYVTNLNNPSRSVENQYNQFTSNSKYDIINKLRTQLHGRTVADLSRYFDGSIPVVATVEGDNWDALRTKYGHTKIDDDKVTYHWLGSNGKAMSGKYADFVAANPTATLNLKKQDAAAGYTNWTDAEVNLNGLTVDPTLMRRDADRVSGFWNFFTPNNDNTWNRWIKQSWDPGMKFDEDIDIKKLPSQLAKILTQLFVTDDSTLSTSVARLKNNWFQQHPEEAIYLIYNQLQQNPNLFAGPHEQEYWAAWHAMLQAFKYKLPSSATATQEVTVQKQGGIIKAEQGQRLDIHGNVIPESETLESVAASIRQRQNTAATNINLIQNDAAANGRGVKQQAEIARNAWTSSDTLRCTALATDIVGLIGAITSVPTGGIGSGVAVASGFASMALDAIADFTDDKVSTGRALKNVGINTGLAIAGAVGGQAPKVIKNTLKLLPRAMMAIGTAGIVLDPEVHKTVAKIGNGTPLDVNDWKNVIVVLRTATGIGTVGALSAGSKKGVNQFDAAVKKKLEKINREDIAVAADEIGVKGADSNVKVIKKSIFDDVNAKLKDGKDAEALSALRNAGLTDAEANSLITTEKVSTAKGIRKLFNKGETKKSLVQATKEDLKQNYSPDDINQAKLETIDELNRLFNVKANKNWHNRLFNKMDKAVGKIPGIKQQNYFHNAAIGNYNAGLAEGENVAKSIGDVKTGLINKSSAMFGPDNNLHMTEAERHALLSGIAPTIIGEKARIETAENLAGTKKAIGTLEKSLTHSDKKITQLEADAKTAETNYQKAQSDFDAAKQNLDTAKNPSRKLGTQLSKKLKLLQEAEKELRIAEQELKTAQDVFADPRLAARYKGVDIVAANNKIEAETARLTLLLNDALTKLNAAKSDPLTARFFTATGNPRTYKGKPAKEILSLLNEVTAAEGNLKNYTKKNSIKESTAWSQYKAALEKQLQASQKVTKLTNSRDYLRTQIDQKRKGLKSLKNKVNTTKTALDTELTNKQNADSKLATQQTRRNSTLQKLDETQRKVAEINTKVKSGLEAERLRQLGQKGHDTGLVMRRSETVTIEGQPKTVAAGTTTESYTFIRDEVRAKQAVLSNTNMKELSQADIKKLFPSKIASLIRGAAFDETTHTVAIWENGGQINSKYSHLRK